MRPADLELVRRLPAFAGLAQATFDRFTHGSFVQNLPRGAAICVQGERPEFLHTILTGRVSLLGLDTGREETVVEFFDPGDMLIVAAVLMDAPYLMSARVAEEARVLFVPAEHVRRTIKLEHDFAVMLAMHLSGHWRRLIRQVKDLKLRTSTERLAAYLVSLADDHDGGGNVQLPEDRKLVAARLGMTAESLSRAFSVLRDVGVGGQGRTVTVADLPRLRAFCRYDGLV